MADGQGMPEAFREPDSSKVGTPELVLGVGVVAGGQRTYTSPKRGGGCNDVLEPCTWTVSRPSASAIVMTTQHSHGGTQCTLRREVTLDGRKVTSSTHLTNTSGGMEMRPSWYCHPFFPRVKDGSVGIFGGSDSSSASLSAQDFYRQGQDGRLQMRCGRNRRTQLETHCDPI